ncbi:DUF1820 family protein [Desulforhopalus singaporensis]|uniref:DUF1820 family protein n=1 Tax=Desulforhopalus singaporensis TaxID=91360 RepID=A0A1H0UHL8_9BACT|nr:DUF1820 family protein [Desulforhopalus singaporensis]SDP65525.1 protein of unknown function [Desulforhopalus singaporensis]
MQKNVFRVHFTWKEKEYVLKAHDLDMTHPYFVAIKALVLPEESSVLINPADDEIRKKFGRVRQLMLPFQSVSLIEEYREDPDLKKNENDVGKKSTKGEVLTPEKFIRK